LGAAQLPPSGLIIVEEQELERKKLALQFGWRKAGKVAAIVNIEFIENAQHPARH
jgi:hypothetical protein